MHARAITHIHINWHILLNIETRTSNSLCAHASIYIDMCTFQFNSKSFNFHRFSMSIKQLKNYWHFVYSHTHSHTCTLTNMHTCACTHASTSTCSSMLRVEKKHEGPQDLSAARQSGVPGRDNLAGPPEWSRDETRILNFSFLFKYCTICCREETYFVLFWYKRYCGTYTLGRLLGLGRRIWPALRWVSVVPQGKWFMLIRVI